MEEDVTTMRPASVLGSICLATILGLLVTTSAAHGEEVFVGDSHLGVFTAPILLLTRADVQADIELSPQKLIEARQAIAALRNRATTAKEESERRQIDHDMTEWLKGHLSPQQFDRLHQIDLQWEGIRAVVRRPIVTEYVRLTDAQKATLRTIVTEHIQARGTQPPTLEDHLALDRKGLAVLSAPQQAQWQRLLGAPCRFAISTHPAQATAATVTGRLR
jgi:hypothetical protein